MANGRRTVILDLGAAFGLLQDERFDRVAVVVYQLVFSRVLRNKTILPIRV